MRHPASHPDHLPRGDPLQHRSVGLVHAGRGREPRGARQQVRRVQGVAAADTDPAGKSENRHEPAAAAEHDGRFVAKSPSWAVHVSRLCFV